MPYSFGYNVYDKYGNDFGHKQASDGKVTRGSYNVLLPDTRLQLVNFECHVSTNVTIKNVTTVRTRKHVFSFFIAPIFFIRRINILEPYN